jgi:hypothetical protein
VEEKIEIVAMAPEALPANPLFVAMSRVADLFRELYQGGPEDAAAQTYDVQDHGHGVRVFVTWDLPDN